VPHWVEPGSLFHIRIALDRQKEQKALTDPALAKAILDSAKFYEARMRWHITLFLFALPPYSMAACSPGKMPGSPPSGYSCYSVEDINVGRIFRSPAAS